MNGSVVFARLHQCAPPSKTCFPRPTRVQIPNGISIGSADVAQLTAESPCTLQWAASFPTQNCPFAWGIWTPSNTWFLKSTRVLVQNNISICSAVSAGLSIVTERPTDSQTERPTHNATWSVTIGRISVVLRCGLIIITRVKVIWQKAASPPHTGGSIVFLRWHQCATHLTHTSLGPPESISKMASRSVQPFLHSSRQKDPTLTMGRPFPPQNCSCTCGDLDPSLIIVS